MSTFVTNRLHIKPKTLRRIQRHFAHAPYYELVQVEHQLGRIVGAVAYGEHYAEFVGTLYTHDQVREITGRVARDTGDVTVDGLEGIEDGELLAVVARMVRRAIAGGEQ